MKREGYEEHHDEEQDRDKQYDTKLHACPPFPRMAVM